jgi:Spy/CpxP family protein refolding chaperone
MRRLMIGMMLLAAAAPLAAAELGLPQGKWWENERLAQRLQLTAEQQSKIRSLVYEHALRMVDLGAAVKRAELEMAEQVQRPSFDADKIRAAFATFQKARMALERERFEMLLAVREVLSGQQWQKIQEIQKEVRRRRELAGDGRAPHPRQPDAEPPGSR